jgi:formylglycine-generating enzyme required for sulfatase activity
MVLIPGGTFTMGSPESEERSRDNERPQHDVTVPSFFMAKYPVTQGQWKAIASRTDLKVKLDLDPEPSNFQEPYQDIDRWERPVEQVNWYEAVEFCKRLSKLKGKYYRLPSEAEWEYACRAGTITPFYFGETITPGLVNYNGNYTYGDGLEGEYREQTIPVGQFPPNAFGLYDMHGNVFEWCADRWHDDYNGVPTDGSVWLKEGNKERSPLRGGSWFIDSYNCRSAFRDCGNGRELHYYVVGFRVVCYVNSYIPPTFEDDEFELEEELKEPETPTVKQSTVEQEVPTVKQFEEKSQDWNFEAPTIAVDQLEEELQERSFEASTVDQRGEIIDRRTYTASYFTEILADGISLEMVLIPGGTFMMGSPKSEVGSRDNERPQHNVTVSPFFMAKYPVTQGQWKAIASRTDLKVNLDLEPEPSRFKKPYQDIDRWQRPVEGVNWYEAAEFCKRLSKLRGRNYRLPSEAEWEYACRAGTTTPFYFGETITPELVNYDGDYTYGDGPKGEYTQQTTPVGQFPPNAFGLYDMHGNVAEWCADEWHENYQNAPTDGSIWLNGNKDRSPLRGGSWDIFSSSCRSAIRSYFLRRVVHTVIIGFRVVCDGGRTL